MGGSALAMPARALESEASVLGAILLDNDVIYEAMSIVRPEQFYSAANHAIYKAMIHLIVERDIPTDPVTLVRFLDTTGELEAVGGRNRVAELLDIVPTASNIRGYAQAVAETALLRDLRMAAMDTAREVDELDATPDEILSHAEERFLRIIETRAGRREAVHVSVIIKSLMERLARRESAPSLPTRLADLDALTGGMLPGQLVVLAARPSMGKSALGVTIARLVATEGTPVLFFSLEMPRALIGETLVAQRAEVNGTALARSTLGDAERGRLATAGQRLAEMPMFVDDQSDITISALHSRARVARARHTIGLILVDYLQLVNGERRKGEGRAEEVGRISRGLKVIAKTLGIPVLAMAQLNREAEARDSHRPRLSDLRESGDIEADADQVWLLHRESYYRRDMADDTGAEVIVAKNRCGPTGSVALRWFKGYVRFSNARE